MPELKEYVVISEFPHEDRPEIWTQTQYNRYVKKAVELGACPAVKVVTSFNLDDDYFFPKQAVIKLTYEQFRDERFKKSTLPGCWLAKDCDYPVFTDSQIMEQYEKYFLEK